VPVAIAREAELVEKGYKDYQELLRTERPENVSP
jgi:hypothetical protein